jgi:hypothetical protein
VRQKPASGQHARGLTGIIRTDDFDGMPRFLGCGRLAFASHHPSVQHWATLRKCSAKVTAACHRPATRIVRIFNKLVRISIDPRHHSPIVSD